MIKDVLTFVLFLRKTVHFFGCLFMYINIFCSDNSVVCGNKMEHFQDKAVDELSKGLHGIFSKVTAQQYQLSLIQNIKIDIDINYTHQFKVPLKLCIVALYYCSKNTHLPLNNYFLLSRGNYKTLLQRDGRSQNTSFCFLAQIFQQIDGNKGDVHMSSLGVNTVKSAAGKYH